jgi:hypothetical protein
LFDTYVFGIAQPSLICVKSGGETYKEILENAKSPEIARSEGFRPSRTSLHRIALL